MIWHLLILRFILVGIEVLRILQQQPARSLNNIHGHRAGTALHLPP